MAEVQVNSTVVNFITYHSLKTTFFGQLIQVQIKGHQNRTETISAHPRMDVSEFQRKIIRDLCKAPEEVLCLSHKGRILFDDSTLMGG